MRTIRRANDRGLADHGWLKSRHTFSFASYHDPAHMGFRSLRVINEDRVAGGGGFGRHPHRDMEILSYVIGGALVHEDSMGTKATIRPGEVQRMSAGTGVEHSERNASIDRATHFLQIWIMPNRRGLPASYAQRSYAQELAKGNMVLVASEAGREDSLSILQDADVYVATSPAGRELNFDVRPKRGVWIQVIIGQLSIGPDALVAGDGFATTDAGPLSLKVTADAEFILFDLI